MEQLNTHGRRLSTGLAGGSMIAVFPQTRLGV